jgi:hypothetical protein
MSLLASLTDATTLSFGAKHGEFYEQFGGIFDRFEIVGGDES